MLDNSLKKIVLFIILTITEKATNYTDL